MASRWSQVYAHWPELGPNLSHVAPQSSFRMQDSRPWEEIYRMQQIREDISEINVATALLRVVRPEKSLTGRVTAYSEIIFIFFPSEPDKWGRGPEFVDAI